MTMTTKHPLRISKHKRAPKTYAKPKALSLDATGLLCHILQNLSTDRVFNHGVRATADYFGISRGRISAAYDELEEKKIVRDVPQKATGKPPRVIRLCSPITIPTCSQISIGETPIKTGESGPETPTMLTDKHRKPGGMLIGEHPYIEGSTTVLQSERVDSSPTNTRPTKNNTQRTGDGCSPVSIPMLTDKPSPAKDSVKDTRPKWKIAQDEVLEAVRARKRAKAEEIRRRNAQ
jgi:DNA-binding transcriptional MocR family regulator